MEMICVGVLRTGQEGLWLWLWSPAVQSLAWCDAVPGESVTVVECLGVCDPREVGLGAIDDRSCRPLALWPRCPGLGLFDFFGRDFSEGE